METIFPDNEEIKFRNKHYKDIKNILKDEVKCTICEIDLLNEIISKKMIVVHKSFLFLCCYNCFYKLCEGHEYSCILCKSNHELSNCEKCNLNVCNRCIENHKIDQVSDGIINNCFNCKLNILWKSRAQAANILKIFYSQLDLPNGLLVNELDREQSVRKYLVKAAKNGQNSTTDEIKHQMCLDFVLNSYKLNINKKLPKLTPKINDDTILWEERISNIFQTCEYILEKTCSTLTDLKRIFDLNTNINPHVSAIMKSLLKPVDDDDNVSNNLRYNNENISKKAINETCQIVNHSSNSNTKKNKKEVLNTDCPNSVLKINTSKNKIQPDTIEKEKKLTVLLERVNDSILSKYNINMTHDHNIHSDVEKDEMTHPLDLFSDINSSDECTKTLRSRKIVKLDKKKRKELTKKKNVPDLSDDERDNNRLINFNNIENSKRKISMTDDDSDISSISLPTYNIKNNALKKSNKNEEDKIEAMKQTIENIDETDSGADHNSDINDEYSLKSVKDVLNEVCSSIGVSEINPDFNSSESDDSSLANVVNECTNTFHKHETDHKCNKNQENQSNLSNIVSSDELQNEENTVCSDISDKDEDPKIINRPKQLSPFNMPSTEDSEDSDLINTKIKKRKVFSSKSSSNSDSSSKYFKKTPRKRRKLTNGKKTNSTHSNSYSSSNNSDSDFTPINSKKLKRIKIISSKESNEESVQELSNDSDEIFPKPTKGRKNIRKMKKLDSLSELTKDALKEEASRKMRVELRQKMYNKIFNPPIPVKSYEKLVLDFDPETKEELVVVHPELVKFLKPHQIEGVKFLWDSVFESLSLIKKNHKGNGSILAHCMGLGKTLQVITLIHTLFKYPEMEIKTVLIITPHATIENWCNEFQKWLDEVPDENNFFIFNFSEAKTYRSREHVINNWRRQTGVLITSYQLFRTVFNFKKINKYPTILEGLVDPGPNLIICDEGHLLKNQNTAISKAINKIKTLRRIVLTGTPLQNNLKEYHCMVDFIRPNLLGTLKDFTNRFINPITNGQYSDSTPKDVKLMKRRSHVLHRMLEGFVQRRDYSVLTPYLPPKNEYVIYLKLSNKQIELYKNYLDTCRQSELFTNYHILQMVWTHPKLLEMYAKRIETKRNKQKLKEIESEFLGDTSSENESTSIEEPENDQQNIPIPGLDPTKTKVADMDLNWWKPFVTKKELESVYPYSKFIMMFSILQQCEEIGDKVLIFSQSLFTLDLIQDFLENATDLTDDSGMNYGKSWILGEDFLRIDGSVGIKDREYSCEQFNDITNTKNRLLLLSTKAFNLGINLVAANRVIIFDVTWNPSLNVQSIFRVFRFGQNKPCYIYRLVSEGTMEQKIYERQISKLSMAFRVVDEHQIDRHFNAKNLEELYEFDPNTSEPKTTLNLPKDRLMAELILKHKDLVMDILEHDSLLQNNQAEELDENDREAAWEDYQKEKEGLLNKPEQFIANNIFSLNNISSNIPRNNQYNPSLNTLNLNNRHCMYTAPEDLKLFNTLKNYFPHASMVQLNDMLIQVKSTYKEP